MSRCHVASELKTTDWILERWAISVGDGLYGIAWEDVPQSRVPPLDDHVAIVVDQLILRSGDQTKKLIGYWYRTSLAKTVIAQKLGIGRDAIYARWNASLWYFRDRFIQSPLSDLRFIASVDVGELVKPASDPEHLAVAICPTPVYDLGANCGNCLIKARVA